MKTIFSLFCLAMSCLCSAQHTGNQLYGNDRQDTRRTPFQTNDPNVAKVASTGNQVTYRVSILNNVPADSFVMTLSLNQEALTPKDCNARINKRIDGFKSALKKLGISNDDLYVDFIAQTKIYDHKSETSGQKVNIDEIEKGFEIKKNILIKIRKISLFEDIVEAASEYDIHNIVKVDYFNDHVDRIYGDMLSQANEILEKKKKQAAMFGESELFKTPQVNIVQYSVQPADSYRNYQAYESSDVSYYNNYQHSDKYFVKQEQRKSKTFYYDGRKPDAYDKVMNADSPVVGLQYVVEITLTYQVNR